jgi:5'-nucleotidase
MEATLLDIPAIALSQMRQGLTARWHTAETHAPDIIRKLTAVRWPPGVLMNVNFPAVTADEVAGTRMVAQGRRAASIAVVEATDPVGRPYLWIGDFTSDDALGQDTDLAAVRVGAIAVTPLHLDLTHGPTLRKLRTMFP